jgi:hypothetical protein
MSQAFNLSQLANKVNTSGQLDVATGVTGTQAVANGGTGQSSYTNGQLLIGNTTGNTLTKATLTAGSGVTITNGAGSITIASSAGVSSLNGQTGAITNTNYDSIGSYVIAAENNFTANLELLPNVTVAGSSLIRDNLTISSTNARPFNQSALTAYSSVSTSGNVSLSLSGTWRRMTRSLNNSSGSASALNLYVRIS